MAKYDYDVLVIGGGAAGLTSAGICASFGAKTALVEKNRLGGDCTWSGCVPSKALLHIAKELSSVKENESLGLKFENISIDFPKVMDSVRKTRQQVYEEADSPELMEKRGVNILNGAATFKNSHTVEITNEDGNQSMTFRSAIITAGGSPMLIPIKGIQDIDFLTNETIFELKKQPKHLVILGSGPIGVEMAQAFHLLGTKVTVIALDEKILIRDEPKCTAVIHEKLQKAGIQFYLGETIHLATKKANGFELSVGPLEGANKTIQGDALLVAVGRIPNLTELSLDKAGVRFAKNGIPVNKYCRTNVKHIYAAGDITTFLKFTHVAENMAKTAAINAVLHFPLFKHEQKVIPWVTYTDPESAHVGKTAKELNSEHIKFDTIELPYNKIDRAVTELQSDGWIIIHGAPSGKILGAHAVGLQAGEIINEYALAMKNGIKLSKISDTIHAYPTMLLGARRAADQFYVRMQKRWMAELIRKFFGYGGVIPDYVGTKTVL